MQQKFTCEIEDSELIESYKRQIFQVATEMGFPYCKDEPVIKTTKDGKSFMDWDFYTTSDNAFDKIGLM